ncbi:hypothetical protein BDV32DRAFT_130217 [Aspergillus pseudonomiae]|uniref:Uncharacterized protein n=1 Tax=Aspergillus pseudonomiae TaxID=1506151 RepID=A0A5N7DED9_9EURO|nr:uncharacterized protein BDV37DRAFT_118516 [Aspergillus pseudonomiae]KAB8255729.1 hypothetical protein BDV32DRAFT_130217 [Aspergillus pseudonomiae]KAE8404098.1 hypothetical protein BDV37DRAFT_118516 [Aspergillus pseudonomiae]
MAVPAAPPGSHDPVNAAGEPSRFLSRPLIAGNTSSDSDEPVVNGVDVAREDEADGMVGVSIGRAQSRMKARSTPAEEKTRAMEHNGGYFDPIPDTDDSSGLYTSEITDEPEELPQSSKPEASQPSASLQNVAHQNGTAFSKDGSNSRTSFTRSILKNGLPLRPRAWSGDTMKKFLPDLGYLTKRTSLPFRSSQNRSRSQTLKPSSSKLALDQEGESHAKPRRRSWNDSDSNNVLVDEPISDLKPIDGATAAKHSFTRRPSATVSGAPLMLRRSSSDQSLYLRASSTASSLDQRPQYEHIHSQVNSRFKAIKDSLQDSSSRLLSMPSLHLQDLRSDWGYKPFLGDVANRKGNNYADEPPPTSDAPREQAPPQLGARPPRVNSNSWHPVLNEAVSALTGDVVIMGGYRGSILRSAKPPQRQLWVPMKVGLNLRKVDLEVGLNPEDEERMEETIIPSGVLSHIGPVDICRRLMKHLRKSENAVKGDLRVWDYGYDWRLSPHLLSKKLIKFLEGLPCNAPGVPPEKRGAYVIAHSLGGLITRHAVNQRPELFAGVLYAGVPQHCVNILGPLRNGDDVLLSSRVLTAQVNFTFRTSFALLPEDGHCFIDKRTKEEYRVDFFNVQDWDEYRLSPVINPALPPMTNKGFGLGGNIGKRFSAVLGSKDSLPSEDTPDDDQQDPNQPGRSNPNPTTDPAEKLAPSIEGVVGPTSNLRGSANVKSTTTVTIPRATAITYLERTLSEVRRFKQELAFNPSHQSSNSYPPFAVLYGKSVPTVYGARISTREQIKHQDAYDDLAFAAGDGVCLASAAMLPPGYRIIKHGLVRSDRGHVGLLGDLEGVGQCLRALVRGRREGVGISDSPLST